MKSDGKFFGGEDNVRNNSKAGRSDEKKKVVKRIIQLIVFRAFASKRICAY